MIDRIHTIASLPDHQAEATQTGINQLDKESSDYMRAAEIQCQKIKLGLIPFSPDAVKWIRQHLAYSSLLHYKEEGKQNRGNLIQLARSVGISNPLALPKAEVKLGLYL